MEKAKILVADDEDYIRLLVKNILGKDYNVLEANDGEEAVHIASADTPDIILMDIMMPKLDGVGACHIIKSTPITQKIPIIMVTALGDELDQQYAKDMGADGYIVKPFSAQKLTDTVNPFLVSPK